jgi:hypothetical protein
MKGFTIYQSFITINEVQPIQDIYKTHDFGLD